MKRIRVDFLIVGAGLAGSVAGFLLKSQFCTVNDSTVVELQLICSLYERQ